MSAIELTAYPGAILGPIAKLLGIVMNGIYNILYQLFGIENVTVSIIVITIIIYMCLLPMTIKQQKFSKLSQKMQPEINAIQEKYKGRRDQESMAAMNQETNLIYQKYGVNPMGTCLPMLIQFPLLMALYRVFYNIPAYIVHIKDYFGVMKDGAVAPGSLVDIISKTSGYQDVMTRIVEEYKLRTISVNFQVTDEAALNNYIVDVLYKLPKSGWESMTSYFSNISGAVDEFIPHMNKFNYLFGMNISDTPWNIITTSFKSHTWLMLVLAFLVPVLSYLTQVLNIKLMPTPDNGNQSDTMARQMKSMNTMMPLMSLFFCFTVPVGLGVYWIFSAVMRAVQQFFINKHIRNLDLDDIIEKNQEKAKKRMEKLGISEDQIRQAAQIKTKNIGSRANLNDGASVTDKEAALERANEIKMNARAGSLASKANLVKDFNERNNRR